MAGKFEIDDCWNHRGTFSHESVRCERLHEFGHCRNCPDYSSAGRQLLDRDLTEEYRRELTKAYAQPPVTEKRQVARVFAFRTGEEWLAVRSRLIQAIVEMGPIHSIPHKSSRIFRGLVNVRGRLELCVSIGGVLRLKPYPKPEQLSAHERLVVAAKAGKSVVFPVSEVMGHVDYDKNSVRPLPVTVSGSRAVYTKGIITHKGTEIGLLDDKLLFRILTRNL